MPFASVNDVSLYYERHGIDGPVIVFAHGRGGNHMSWWQQIPAFAHDHRCLTFDHRSFGLTRNADDGRDQDAFANDLARLLDHLDIDRVHLVGQSMGGRTCLDFAVRHPDRVDRMVLASTIAGVVDPALAALVTQHGGPPRELLPRVLSEGFRTREPMLSFLFAQIEALNHVHGSPFALARRGASADDLARCAVPTLLLVGDQDKVAPPAAIEWMKNVLPCASYHLVPDTGHSVYYEQPAIFNALVRRHLCHTPTLD